jgi:acyl carrier protein
MSGTPNPASPASDLTRGAPPQTSVIEVVLTLVRELHPGRGRVLEVRPDSRIERDLGIDSLARIELILRLERTYHVHLPTKVAGEAETVADLLAALEQAGSARTRSVQEARPHDALATVSAASGARTLIEVLEWHASRHPDRRHLTLLEDETTVTATSTYGELRDRARKLACSLIGRDVAPGDRVGVMLPTSVEFFVSFFGILYARAIPVPIYPPMRISQLEEHLRRQTGILRNAGAGVLIVPTEGRRLADLMRLQIDSLKSVTCVSELEADGRSYSLPQGGDAEAVALIQYTSGSTGDPKGVVLSHANLLANIRAMGMAMEASSDDVFMSWLPLYHDMGLIGAWLGCMYFGAPLYVMSPLSFLVRPESWLWSIHRYRATLSASPNFGFELCLNKIEDADLEGLDLGSLRMVANGAEPVSVLTLRRFIGRFERYGFAPPAMAPVYGLAECSVGLAFPPPNRAPRIDRIDRELLSTQGIAEPVEVDNPKPLEIVACGQPLPGHEVRIVDQAGYEVGERREGRIEFRGPSATRGYFRNEAKTRELLRDGWLDSGDRGYLAGGDIHITGRIKDIIIRAGRHLYPQEIEEAVATVPRIRKGGVAVFGVTDPASGTERLVVLAETNESDQLSRAALEEQVRRVTTDVAGTPPDEVVLAPPRTVPKTSSGKIRRSAAKELYERGHVGLRQRALWWQVSRLALSGIRSQLRRAVFLVGDALYATWWWLMLGLALLLGGLAVLVVPRLAWRWSVLRRLARATLVAMGIRITVDGLEHIHGRNMILAFNHASYTDALILLAVLPGEPAFVAKREFARQAIIGPLLRRLGIPFVERYDVAGSLADAEALIAVARQGRNLVFFPEGTFTRRPGLSEFYLGTFKVAAEANSPVAPGVIRGTRSMLRANQWWPRRSAISVEIAPPIQPTGNDFEAVLRLRDAVRHVMLDRCGEPDLGELIKPPAADERSPQEP